MAEIDATLMELEPTEKESLVAATDNVDDPEAIEDLNKDTEQESNKENESTNLTEESEEQPSELEPEKSKVPEEVATEAEQEASVAVAPTEEEEGGEKTEKLSKLPLGRIKHIMKLDPDVTMASQDCVFLISKATELFVDSLAKECYTYTVQNKKKTISKNDVDTAVEAVDCLAFLEGAIED